MEHFLEGIATLGKQNEKSNDSKFNLPCYNLPKPEEMSH